MLQFGVLVRISFFQLFGKSLSIGESAGDKNLVQRSLVYPHALSKNTGSENFFVILRRSKRYQKQINYQPFFLRKSTTNTQRDNGMNTRQKTPTLLLSNKKSPLALRKHFHRKRIKGENQYIAPKDYDKRAQSSLLKSNKKHLLESEEK